jgi:DNA-binding MarR family transcriptional regulator
MLKLDDYLPYLVNRVGQALVDRFTKDALSRHGLGIDMWRLLVALEFAGGRRQVDLAGMTSIEKSTVSRLVTKLVRMGLATRGRSRESNREVAVQLSARGRMLVARLIPVATDLEREASVGIASKDMASAKRLLRKVYENLSNGGGG